MTSDIRFKKHNTFSNANERQGVFSLQNKIFEFVISQTSREPALTKQKLEFDISTVQLVFNTYLFGSLKSKSQNSFKN